MNRIAAVVAGLSLAFVGTSATIAGDSGTTWTVCSSGCDFTSIQDAITSAADEDTISIHAGTYYESNLKIEGKSLTIQGAGAGTTIIDAQYNHRCLEIHGSDTSDTTISGLTLQNGDTVSSGTEWNGGGIWINSDATIQNVEIKDCTAYNYGGGIYMVGASPSISNCNVTANASNGQGYAGGSARGGGIYCSASSAPSISGCMILNNESYANVTAPGLGGGIYCSATQGLVISDCHITGNIVQSFPTPGKGSAIYGDGSAEVHFTGCTISGTLHNAEPQLLGTAGSSFRIEDSTVCGTGDFIHGMIHFDGGNDIHDCIDDGDMDNDGDVDTDDLNALHDALGIERTDVNNTGCVNIDDLLLVVEDWGEGCTP